MSCLASRLRHRHNTTQTNIVPAYQLVPRSCKPALDAATYQSARRDILADFAKGVVLQVVFQRILARIGTAVAAYALRPDRALRQPNTMYINLRGIAAKLGRPMAQGAIWGIDFLLDDDQLFDNVCASALT